MTFKQIEARFADGSHPVCDLADCDDWCSLVTDLWDFMYLNDEGEIDPDQDIPGADLVDKVNELFARHGIRPEGDD